MSAVDSFAGPRVELARYLTSDGERVIAPSSNGSNAHQLQLLGRRRRPIAEPDKLGAKPGREHRQRPRHPNPQRVAHRLPPW